MASTNYSTSKILFIERLKTKTRKLAVDIILFINQIKSDLNINIVFWQLIKSSTSTGANYRAACRARSKGEFFSKMSIVVEESDETLYWLEIIDELNIKCDQTELERLKSECLEIIKITSVARSKKYESI